MLGVCNQRAEDSFDFLTDIDLIRHTCTIFLMVPFATSRTRRVRYTHTDFFVFIVSTY